MNRLATRRLPGIHFLLASSCLVVLSSAPSNAQSGHGNQHRLASGDSIITQRAEPLGSDSMSTWGPRVLRATRELSFFVVPATRWMAAIGAVGAAALAVHYHHAHPYPTMCHPSAQDKWQHCYVGCQIATWFPVGALSSSILAILKEVRDAMDHGTFSWPDALATLRGAWDCAGCTSCEACCCEQLGLHAGKSIIG